MSPPPPPLQVISHLVSDRTLSEVPHPGASPSAPGLCWRSAVGSWAAGVRADQEQEGGAGAADKALPREVTLTGNSRKGRIWGRRTGSGRVRSGASPHPSGGWLPCSSPRGRMRLHRQWGDRGRGPTGQCGAVPLGGDVSPGVGAPRASWLGREQPASGPSGSAPHHTPAPGVPLLGAQTPPYRRAQPGQPRAPGTGRLGVVGAPRARTELTPGRPRPPLDAASRARRGVLHPQSAAAPGLPPLRAPRAASGGGRREHLLRAKPEGIAPQPPVRPQVGKHLPGGDEASALPCVPGRATRE